ncbi:hypothetical protein F2P81_013182 [Scophthalmus maximus]|uniref:Secreted protein n=1 Tax=Scophthalmus maximus TaxID=52904 RepID=A0A6A4SWI4_SCOMX|nr:hypothetical protein F2P81_013182 [Scophthalmus maximus]
MGSGMTAAAVIVTVATFDTFAFCESTHTEGYGENPLHTSTEHLIRVCVLNAQSERRTSSRERVKRGSRARSGWLGL